MLMTPQARVEGDVTVLDIEGRLFGGPETKEICESVRSLVAEGRKRRLVNLAGVPWANSLAIGTLVSCYTTAKRRGAHLEICCLSARVEMILRTEKLIPVLFDPYRTEKQAMAGFEIARPEDHPDPR